MRTLRRKIRRTGPGFNVVADVNAAVASGTAPRGGANVVSSRQRVRIVQRSSATTDTTNIETETPGETETAGQIEAAGETGENR